MGSSVRLSRCDLARFEGIAAEWDRLAAGCGNPFLTSAWFVSWWRAFAGRDGVALVLRSDEGLLAGGCFRELGHGALVAAANAHTNDWDVVARDDAARRRLWEEVAQLGYRRLILDGLPGEELPPMAPAAALSSAGYRSAAETLEPSPVLDLPASLEDLLAGRSRNLRSQVGRRRRRLEKEGALDLRVVRGGETLRDDLDAFFELEAAGWKGGGGTAIAGDRSLLALYRGFAEAAAKGGWLRLYLLELDGRLLAADYGCVFAGCGYLIKTAFDEEMGRFAPGLVLRAAVIESSIAEGLDRYDFLGGPDAYKLRWTDDVRVRSSLHAFKGVRAAPAYAWRASLRPALKSARGRMRRSLPSGDG
jgi:CelD/BcsL family acetyltransferase involved in cellulose biosynthesis